MTVGQLIDRLKEFDRDLHVVITAEDNFYFAVGEMIDPEEIYVSTKGNLVINGR